MSLTVCFLGAFSVLWVFVGICVQLCPALSGVSFAIICFQCFVALLSCAFHVIRCLCCHMVSVLSCVLLSCVFNVIKCLCCHVFSMLSCGFVGICFQCYHVSLLSCAFSVIMWFCCHVLLTFSCGFVVTHFQCYHVALLSCAFNVIIDFVAMCFQCYHVALLFHVALLSCVSCYKPPPHPHPTPTPQVLSRVFIAIYCSSIMTVCVFVLSCTWSYTCSFFVTMCCRNHVYFIMLRLLSCLLLLCVSELFGNMCFCAYHASWLLFRMSLIIMHLLQ